MSEKKLKRFLEIIPGGLFWLTFILAIVLSFLKPLWVIYFIIVYCLFWLFRVISFCFYLLIAWRRYRSDIKVNWQARVEQISGWQDIYHLIFLPTYKEGVDIIRNTFEGLARVKYPLNKMIVVLAGEERDAENFLRNAEIIKNEFGSNFFKFLVTVHPKDLPDEIPGKGSNINYAGRKSKELIDNLGIPYRNIIVSDLDIDSCVHPQYFAYLSHQYLTHPNPTRTSYQPVALYNNNIWVSSAIVRVASIGTVFWLLSELARPEDHLCTFSSHSMSFEALEAVGFRQRDIVSDDSRIFYQCFLHYNGNYTVTPMFIPVSMNTVMVKGHFRSLVNLYNQQKRWAWGVENFPYIVLGFIKNKQIVLRKKIKYVWNLLEGMYTWATAPLLIFLLGRLPLWVGGEKIKSFVIVQNTPLTLEWLMNFAMIGLVLSAILTLGLLPPRPKDRRAISLAVMILQWLLLPLTLIIFGSIPAIDAQTRLMLGKYLGFRVTEKEKI